MKFFLRKPRKSARAIIVKDGKALLFKRKRLDTKTGKWLEYYSVPGGGIDKGETPEQAVIRELKEEMGVDIVLGSLIARRIASDFEHYVYSADVVAGTPQLMPDSEEAQHMSEYNQYEAVWVSVSGLTLDDLSYYSDYLDLMQQLARGERPQAPVKIVVP